MWQNILKQIQQGDFKHLARAISLVENECEGYEILLQDLPPSITPIIGITGPPGAGKSTLVNGIIAELIKQDKKIGIICIDPSSPFNLGALLGDRIRMNEWYTHPNVFIRSLATRGAMGGLSSKIIEVSDLMKAADFDFIIIETVGVGQTEIEIAGLADCTVVVLVPEAGDEIQTMKAGLMEIANVFVVNKADRPDANKFIQNLKLMLAPSFSNNENLIEIIPAVATENKGVEEILEAIDSYFKNKQFNHKKIWLLTQHLLQLIQKNRMNDLDKQILVELVKQKHLENTLNIYQLAKEY